MTVPLNENFTDEGTDGECRALVLFNDYSVTRDEQGGPCLKGSKSVFTPVDAKGNSGKVNQTQL